MKKPVMIKMNKSIEAYNLEERVARYDADMDLMHPNRHKMVEIALEVLPYPPDSRILALDLGIGTGFFTARFLEHYPHGRVIGLDGAEAMLDLARIRLKKLLDRVELVKTPLERGGFDTVLIKRADVIFSSYSLHHLNAVDKLRLLTTLLQQLAPGGWFVNADLVSNPFPEINNIIRDLRVRGVHRRNAGADPRFTAIEKIRHYIRSLEQNECDQPLTIEDDLGLLRQAGIPNASIFWKEFGEVVYGGQLPTLSPA